MFQCRPHNIITNNGIIQKGKILSARIIIYLIFKSILSSIYVLAFLYYINALSALGRRITKNYTPKAKYARKPNGASNSVRKQPHLNESVAVALK